MLINLMKKIVGKLETWFLEGFLKFDRKMAPLSLPFFQKIKILENLKSPTEKR
jgi:hypothetical protein